MKNLVKFQKPSGLLHRGVENAVIYILKKKVFFQFVSIICCCFFNSETSLNFATFYQQVSRKTSFDTHP